MKPEELDKYITSRIQGVFSVDDIKVLKEEIERLEEGQVYVEVGVDEGRSARVVHEYAKEGVYKLFIDIHDPTPRGPFMEEEGMVGLGKQGFYIHGDADEFGILIQPLIRPFVNLLFLDPHHDYDSIKRNTLIWESFVEKDGVILFHDYDHPETKRWLDEHYGDKKEVINGKIVRVRK